MELRRSFNGACRGLQWSTAGVVGALSSLQWSVSGLQWSTAGVVGARRRCNGASPELQWSAAGVVGALSRLQWSFTGTAMERHLGLEFFSRCGDRLRLAVGLQLTSYFNETTPFAAPAVLQHRRRALELTGGAMALRTGAAAFSLRREVYAVCSRQKKREGKS
ncbi:hypothetical protein VPH35_078321 [Triticum aestivum]